MNEIINKQNFIEKLIQGFKNNNKIIILIASFSILLFVVIKIYFFYENKNILESSIKYNIAKSNSEKADYEKIINEVSLENNFYGVLASLDKIKILIKANNIELAHKEYLSLLNKDEIDSIYKTAIAINASYTMLDKIYLKVGSGIGKSIEQGAMIEYLNKYLEFVDPTLKAYEAAKLELVFLISVIINKENNDISSFEKMENSYNQLIKNENIPSSLKERVKKIHEFQIYK